MLVYQDGGTSEQTLEIAAGTKAIGFRAAVNLNYNTVTIPSGLKTIYGAAFFGSKMTKVDGDLTSITYLSAMAGNNEVYDKYDGTYPFENHDATMLTNYKNNQDIVLKGARFGAFKKCASLATLDFTQLTSLKIIGYEAFSGCTNLEHASSKTYNMYSYVGKELNQSADIIDVSQNPILDLSDCASLTNIQSQAFKGVDKIKYTILPNTVGKSITATSTLTLDAESNVLPPKSVHLIGDTYHQASINFGHISRTSHYPDAALRSNDNYNYFRIFVEDLPDGITTENYCASSYDGNIYNEMQYWTIYNGNYYLFKGRDQVLAFRDKVDDNAYTTPGMALN